MAPNGTRTAARLRPRPAQTDGRTHGRASPRASCSRLHLSAPGCQGPRQEVMFAPPGTVSSSFCPLPLPPPLLLPPSPPLPSTSPLICWRRWHLPQSGLRVCAPVGGGCPGRRGGGGRGGGQPEVLCECKWPHIHGRSSLTARLRVHVEIKEESSPRSWSEPVMTSPAYALGNVAPGNGACRGVLVKSKRSRLLETLEVPSAFAPRALI